VARGDSLRLLSSQALRVAWLGEAYLLAGEAHEAREAAARSLAMARDYRERGNEADALRLSGEIAWRADPPDLTAAGASYRGALSIANALEIRPLVAHCHLGLGKLYRRTDQREQAGEHLATAATMYREMGMTYWLEKAEAEVQELG
jgi:tetratricopeptide (TPR) repeat protein